MRNTRETPTTAEWWDDDSSVADSCGETDSPSRATFRNGNSWSGQLRKTIESEIVPRLVMAHRAAGAPQGPATSVRIAIETDTVEQFAALIVEHELEVLRAYVHALCEEGQSLQSVFLELFVPAARHLGEEWKQDTRDFSEVTLGLSRLQQLLQEFGRQLEPNGEVAHAAGRAMLVAPEDEQHTFGLSILTEFFRRDGWDVSSTTLSNIDDIATVLRHGGFHVLGFSVSQESMIDRVAACIREVRREMDAQELHIMVGGRVFLDNPALVLEVGADSTAPDADRAVQRARFYLEQHAGRAGRRVG